MIAIILSRLIIGCKVSDIVIECPQKLYTSFGNGHDITAHFTCEILYTSPNFVPCGLHYDPADKCAARVRFK